MFYTEDIFRNFSQLRFLTARKLDMEFIKILHFNFNINNLKMKILNLLSQKFHLLGAA